MIIGKRHPLVRYFGLSAMYSHMARYGQDPGRPAFFLTLVFIIGSFYWFSFFSLGFDKNSSELSIPSSIVTTAGNGSSINFTTSLPSLEINKVSIYSVWTPIERTLINIVSLYEKPLFADLLIRIISLPMIALLVVALRRKLERKYRH